MPDEKSRELRFGLVMYGGVSLAVYINGVSHEFSRLVRGNGVYKLIKGLTDTEMIVDIMSGTSAGGINGIFLSYALANERDFGAIAALWRELGDISKLLRKPETGPANSKSLIDSEGYYHQQLHDAFERMPAYHDPSDDPGPRDEIDLFVTGTDADGEVYTVFDDTGHTIDVKDYRSVFWLKHRAGRKTPFEPKEETYAALAKLARITSAFPGAFQPVHVAHQPAGDAPDSVDGSLQEWGALAKETYFLDGGVLDNKPFTHTIRAIAQRTAVRPVTRILCYVDPDPDRFETDDKREIREPDFLSAAFEGAMGIKSYESIADDLKMIAEHNAQVGRYRQTCRKLRGAIDSGMSGIVPPDTMPKAQRQSYIRARMAAFGMRAMQGLLAMDDEGQPVQLEDNQLERAQALVRELIDLPTDEETLSEEESFARFDVYFRLRRARHVAYRISEEIGNAIDQPPSSWKDLWISLNAYIELLDIFRYWIEYVMDRAKINWMSRRKSEEIWHDVRWYLEQLLTSKGGRIGISVTPSGLKELHRALGSRAKQVVALKRGGRATAKTFRSLLQETDDAQLKLFDRGIRLEDFKLEFVEFVGLDAIVFPLEYVSELQAKHPIHTLRISPIDAKTKFWRRGVEEKLAGDGMAHFAGFLKRSWRSNDILWGRLDAVHELVESTLTRSRLQHILDRGHLRNVVQQRLVSKDYEARNFFPHAPSPALARLDTWLHDLFAGNQNLALDKTQEMVELITELAQLETLYECLPTVIADAAMEQASWNQYKVIQDDPDDEEILSRCRTLQFADTATPAEVARVMCLELAKWTSQDRARMDRLWRVVQPGFPERLVWWDTHPPGDSRTNGEKAVADAIKASFRILAADKSRGFEAAPAFVDGQLATLAAEQLSRAAVADWLEGPAPAEPSESKIARFFATEYRVGSEDVWTDIPPSVLVEIFSQAALVLKNCVLGAFSEERRKRIEGNLIFRLVLDWPLSLTYWLSRLFRREPAYKAGLRVAMLSASLLTLVLTFFGKETLLWRASVFQWNRFAILVVLPIVILSVMINLSKRRVVLWAYVRGLLSAAGVTLTILSLSFAARHWTTMAAAVRAAWSAFWIIV